MLALQAGLVLLHCAAARLLLLQGMMGLCGGGLGHAGLLFGYGRPASHLPALSSPCRH